MLFLVLPLALLLMEARGGREDSEDSEVAPWATDMLSFASCAATGVALDEERHEPYQLDLLGAGEACAVDMSSSPLALVVASCCVNAGCASGVGSSSGFGFDFFRFGAMLEIP
jgi:hypothetical protein